MKLGDFPSFSKTMDTDCPFILLSYCLGEHVRCTHFLMPDEHLAGQIDGHKDFWRVRQTLLWTDRQADTESDGQTDARTDTRMDSQPDTWTDRRTH